MPNWIKKVIANQIKTSAEPVSVDLPSFIQNKQAQDNLLKELYVIDDLEKEIFYKLCKIREKSNCIVFDLKEILDSMNCVSAGNKETACKALFEKMDQFHIGKIFTVKEIDPNDNTKLINKEKLSFGDKNSYEYFSASITDLYTQLSNDPSDTKATYPNKKLLANQTINPLKIPEELCQGLDYKMLSPKVIENNRYQNRIFLIPLTIHKTPQILLCPSALLPELISSSKLVIKTTLLDATYKKTIDAIIKANQLSPIVFEQVLSSNSWKEILNWINPYILQCDEGVLPKPTDLPESFWQALMILPTYLNNKATEEEALKKAQERFNTALESTSNAIKDSIEPISYKKLAELIREKAKELYQAKLTEEIHTAFFNEFKNRYLNKTIFYIDDEHIMHINNIASDFQYALDELKPNIIAELTKEMRSVIKQGPTAEYSFLNNQKSYNEKLTRLIKREASFLLEIRKLNGETIYRSAELKDKSKKQLGRTVAQLFYVNSYTLKDWDDLLDLSLSKLFEETFEKLNPILKFIYKYLNGRYNSLNTKFKIHSTGYVVASTPESTSSSTAAERYAKRQRNKSTRKTPTPAKQQPMKKPLDRAKVLEKFTDLMQKPHIQDTDIQKILRERKKNP